MDSMFRATDTTYDYVIAADKQSLTDNTFIMRDSKHGLNMDLMTYTMYNLANKDPQALLDYTRLAANADYTLQTFFQHFVRNQLSLAQGGLTFQSMNDRGFESLGSRIDENGKPLPEKSWPELNVERNITGTISEKIQILHMNEIATYLTVAILIWLIGTTALVTCLQRRYTALLLRDVQLIADVLVLVAGSDNFLELVARQGVTLKNSKDVKTMLGWFKDRQGEVRWGVEVVGGPNAVEWVDAPKQGFHIPVRSTRRMWLPWRRS